MIQKSICILGQHELDYPRNRTIKKVFQRLKLNTIEVHSRIPFPQRHISLLLQFFKVQNKFKTLWITEGGHRFVPLFRLISIFTGHKIIFDPFTSRYNTRVEDRKLHKPKSLQAWICFWQDWSSCKSAHTLVFDTIEHKEYFYTKYSLNKPFEIIPVLISEENFINKKNTLSSKKTICNILFYGTFIPLQGIQTIVEASRLAQNSLEFHFSIVGNGQTHNEMIKLASGLKNITFIDTVSEFELSSYINRADICLGIFGDTAKASRVVPNKVVQCAAIGKPIITRESKAINNYFEHSSSIYTIPPNSPIALFEAIKLIYKSPSLHNTLSQNSKLVFKRSFSQESVLNKITKLVYYGKF